MECCQPPQTGHGESFQQDGTPHPEISFLLEAVHGQTAPAPYSTSTLQHPHLTCGRSSAPAAARLSPQQAPCSGRCGRYPVFPAHPGESLQRAGRGHWIRATPSILLCQELWSCSGSDGLGAVSASCSGQGSSLGSGG